jgi:hypothetical protein
MPYFRPIVPESYNPGTILSMSLQSVPGSTATTARTVVLDGSYSGQTPSTDHSGPYLQDHSSHERPQAATNDGTLVVTNQALAYQNIAEECPLCFRERHIDGSQCSEFKFLQEIGRQAFGPIPLQSLLLERDSDSLRRTPPMAELCLFRIALMQAVVHIRADGHAQIPISLFILPVADLRRFPRYNKARLHVLLVTRGLRSDIKCTCLGFETAYDMMWAIQSGLGVLTPANVKVVMDVILSLWGQGRMV